jgi:hypothetical protein
MTNPEGNTSPNIEDFTSPKDWAHIPPPCGFIDDGYTRSGTIPVDSRFHPELQFTFRPCTQSERVSIYYRISKFQETEDGLQRAEDLAHKTMATHIMTWDLQDRNYNSVEIAEETLSKLEPHLSQKLFRVIMGEIPPAPRQPTDEDMVKN